MEELLNKAIIVSESCVSDCLKHSNNSSMSLCIRNCLVNERICKALKTAIKNKCNQSVLNSLKEACLESGLCVVEECSKHQMKCCKDCVVHISKLNNKLKLKSSKKKSSKKKSQ